MLVMTGRQKTFVILSFASLLIDVLLALALVPGLGLTGAAIATATSGLFFSSATVLAVKEYFGIWPVDARMLKGCVATLATLGALFLLKRCEFATPALRVLTVACASVTVFAVCLGLLGLDSEDADALYSLRRRLMSVRF